MPVILTIDEFEHRAREGRYTPRSRLSRPYLPDGSLSPAGQAYVLERHEIGERLVRDLEELYGTRGFPDSLKTKIMEHAYTMVAYMPSNSEGDRAILLSDAYRSLCNLIASAMEEISPTP